MPILKTEILGTKINLNYQEKEFLRYEKFGYE